MCSVRQKHDENSDVVESVSAAYGMPPLASARTRTSAPAEAFPDSIVLARWENAESLLALVRGSYTPELQLILISKPLSARARNAVREAIRLDAIEAPRREAEQRKKEASNARAARDKTRIVNKAPFVLDRILAVHQVRAALGCRATGGVAAYAAWTVDHGRVGRRGAEGSHDAARYGDLPSEQLGRP